MHDYGSVADLRRFELVPWKVEGENGLENELVRDHLFPTKPTMWINYDRRIEGHACYLWHAWRLGHGAFTKFQARTKLEPVRAENSHEPLVNNQLFQKVQQLMRSRSPKISAPRVVASPYLLSGIVKCGGCKKAMFGVAAKSGKYHYYNCATRYRTGKSECSTRAIRVEKMDGAVLEAVLEQVLQPDHLTRLFELVAEEHQDLMAEQSVATESVRLAMADVERRLTRNYEALEEGKLELLDLAPRIRALREEREQLAARIAEHEVASGQTPVVPTRRQIVSA